MDTLSMTRAQSARWRFLMCDVRLAAARRHKGGSRETLKSLSYLLTRGASDVKTKGDDAWLDRTTEPEGSLYTVVRLGRIFRGALQIDANGAGKDITAAIRLIERAEEDGRITASQRIELFEIMGVPS